MVFDGLLLVDKPAGWTSHDVVGRMRRIAGQKRIGHTGTLDPAATGLLVVCLGSATRMVEYMTGHDKRYEGIITLGTSTTTDDAEGTPLATSPVPDAADIDLRALESQFTGKISQRPPAFSAISVGGRRAYDVARAGGDPSLPPRRVTIHSLSLEWRDATSLTARVHCGSGTYIRSLARDIGGAIGCGAHLSALRRTQAGPFGIADAWTLEALAELGAAGRLGDALLSADAGLASMNSVVLDLDRAARAVNGLNVDAAPEYPTEPGTMLRMYGPDGQFIGIGEYLEGSRVHAHKVLRANT